MLAVLCGVLGVAMLAQVALLGLYAFEHARFHRGRRRRPIDNDFTPSVALIVPCKGLELHLEEHLTALFRLRYPHYELCLVVESASDPVLDAIDSLRRKFAAVPSRVVVAGLAEGCGQKVHNLMQAARTVPPSTEVLAFVDSDASPGPDWLRRLVSRMKSDPRALGTGYRWYHPVRPTSPNLALAALNNLILLLMGPNPLNLAWGGAWGARRETFAELGLPDAWDGSLSDDLTVSRLAQAAGAKIAFEPHCLSISPADTTWSGLWEFARRQYRIVRVYQPGFWRGSLAAGLLTTLLLAGGPVLALAGALSGGMWLLPLVLSTAYYLLTALRISIQLRGVRPYLNAPAADIRRVERVSVWLWPLVIAANWLLVASTAFGRGITWRGIRYRLDSPTRTTILSRGNPRSETAPAQKAA